MIVAQVGRPAPPLLHQQGQVRDVVVRLVESVLEDAVVLYFLRRFADLFKEFIVDLLDHDFSFVQFCLKFLLLVNEIVLLELVLHEKGMISLVQQ